MKRLLFESVKAIPYSLAQAVDRLDALSGVLGISVTSADENTVATITVAHCDTSDGEYSLVTDERLFLDDTIVERDAKNKSVQSIVTVGAAEGELVNIDIDLVGCKRFVKINVEYAAGDDVADVTAAYVFTLGDFGQNPPGE